MSNDKARLMVECIVYDPNIFLGKPAIMGTRVCVEHILDRMADGWSVEQILKAYPNLQTADVLAALAFTAELVRQRNFSAFCLISYLRHRKNSFRNASVLFFGPSALKFPTATYKANET